MARSTKWEAKEVESLKIGFLKKVPVKVQARELGRSPSAVNKALTRFNIRQSMSLSKSFKQYIPYRWGMTKQRIPACVNSMDDVVFYLRRKGFYVEWDSLVIDGLLNFRFFINARPTTPIRLLVLANMIRLEEKQPIFIFPRWLGPIPNISRMKQLSKPFVYEPPMLMNDVGSSSIH